MRHFSRLRIRPDEVARTPRRLGVNAELQDHHDETNLWDWIADSGAGAVREFHPEVSLRRAPAEPGTWGPISGRADFDA